MTRGARTFLSAIVCALAPHPGGIAENSPTFQRWGREFRRPQVPQGRLKPCAIRQPSLRDLLHCGRGFPTLKRGAILACPSGTKLQRFGVAAKGLEPCESGRQLEQQREQLPGGEPQQQQPDQPEQQPRVPFRPAPSSTRLPDGSGADPAAILSPAAVLPGQIREQKPPGASRLAEPVENSGRPCSSFRTDGGAAKSSVRSGMFIATRAPESVKLRRSGMSLRSLGCRWAYAAPTELDRASGAVVAINMSLLTELAGPLMAAPHDSANDNSAKHDSVLP